MRWRSRWRWMVAPVLGVVLASCADDPLVAPTVSENEVVAAVTPDVAAMLDANGKFVFQEPAPGSSPWITADRAVELAQGYLKGYGPPSRERWRVERDAGVAEHLSPCRRVFLAESGYDPFPAELVREYRRALGPMWTVSFCSGGEQQVAIAVSVEATDLTIDEEGIVVGLKSGDFISKGVPVGVTFPIEPEVGAVEVAGTVNARVKALPRYRRLADLYGPYSGIWTYEVESTVRMRGDRSGVNIDTNVVDFSRWASIRDLRPVMANQDSASKSRSEVFQINSGGGSISVEVFRRVDVPVSLESFTVGGPGRP